TRARWCCICCLTHCYSACPCLHSLPTRRSSDLGRLGPFDTRRQARAEVKAAIARTRTGLMPSVPYQTVSEHVQGWLERKRAGWRSEEHTSELQSRFDLVCRLLLEKKKAEANKSK